MNPQFELLELKLIHKNKYTLIHFRFILYSIVLFTNLFCKINLCIGGLLILLNLKGAIYSLNIENSFVMKMVQFFIFKLLRVLNMFKTLSYNSDCSVELLIKLKH